MGRDYWGAELSCTSHHPLAGREHSDGGNIAKGWRSRALLVSVFAPQQRETTAHTSENVTSPSQSHAATGGMKERLSKCKLWETKGKHNPPQKQSYYWRPEVGDNVVDDAAVGDFKSNDTALVPRITFDSFSSSPASWSVGFTTVSRPNTLPNLPAIRETL
jgi:hypothetical protein